MFPKSPNVFPKITFTYIVLHNFTLTHSRFGIYTYNKFKELSRSGFYIFRRFKESLGQGLRKLKRSSHEVRVRVRVCD